MTLYTREQIEKVIAFTGITSSTGKDARITNFLVRETYIDVWYGKRKVRLSNLALESAIKAKYVIVDKSYKVFGRKHNVLWCNCHNAVVVQGKNRLRRLLNLIIGYLI
jgi:hypothetical protein